MKKFILITLLFTGAAVYKANAQFSLSINIASRQPDWGPAGYDNAQYYYLPDCDAYYDVPNQQFVYFDDGRWNCAAALPEQYGNVDLYNTYKVVINDRNPWLRNDYYRDHYAQYRGQYQPMIRDMRNDRRSAYNNGYTATRFDNHRALDVFFNRDRGYRNHDEDRGSWGRDDRGSRGRDDQGRGRDDHQNNSFDRDGHDRR